MPILSELLIFLIKRQGINFSYQRLSNKVGSNLFTFVGIYLHAMNKKILLQKRQKDKTKTWYVTKYQFQHGFDI